MAFYMVPTLAFSVAFNLPKFFEFVIQWAPTSRAVVVDAATNETRIENGTEMAFKGHVDRVVCFLNADKAKGLLALMTLLKKALVVDLCWSISDR